MTATKSKIIQHPGTSNTPLMTISDALGRAQAGEVADVLIIFTDNNGRMHVAWSKQSNEDLAANAVILAHIAATRLLD